jgi:hypothetical protein
MCLKTIQYPGYTSYSVHSGIAGGGAFEYVRATNSSSETLRSRRIRAAIDVPILALFDPSVTISDVLHFTDGFA